MIDSKGAVNSSKETMVALPTASSIAVPSLGSQQESPSANTTTLRQAESTAVFIPSIWSKDFNTVVPTVTNPEQNRSTDVDTEWTHCAPGEYYTVFSSLCSTLSGIYGGMTAQNDPSTSSELVLDATNQTAIELYTGTRQPRTSAVLSSEDSTERAILQATESRGRGDRSAAATGPKSTTAPYQTLEKSRYGDTDEGTIRPFDTASSITRPPSASPTPQPTICTSGQWNLNSLSSPNTRTEAAISVSVSLTRSLTSTPPSVPPTLASTGHIATSRCIWILICLWAISITHT